MLNSFHWCGETNMVISNEEITNFQTKLARNLNKDRNSGESACDLVLMSQGKEFKVHKNVLMVSSNYFKSMLTAEMKEKYSVIVEIQQVPPDRLSHIIDYIYTGRITVNKDNMLDVYEDADYLQLEDLKLKCLDYICSVVSVDNCLQLQNFAKRHSLEKLLTKCLFKITINFTQVVQMPDFLHLDSDMLTAIVQQTPKELWTDYSPEKRKEHFEKIFSQLDLSLVSPDFLSEMTKQKLVGNDPNCLRRIVDKFSELLSGIKNDAGKIVIMGGKNTMQNCVNYDVITSPYQKMPKPKTGRCDPASVKVEGNIYLIGGAESTDGTNPRKSCEVLDLNEQTEWKSVSPMLEARDSCGATFSDGYIYVVGGYNKGTLQSCEKFDIKNDKWTRIADIERARYGHGLVSSQGCLYCFGGKNEDQLVKLCECYDIKNNKWGEFASLNERRYYVACVELNGCIYAIGGLGVDGSAIKTVEKYTPEDDKWEFVAPLLSPRHGHSACVVGSRIVVVGGKNTNSVEFYDPDSNEWTKTFLTYEDVFFATVQSL